MSYNLKIIRPSKPISKEEIEKLATKDLSFKQGEKTDIILWLGHSSKEIIEFSFNSGFIESLSTPDEETADKLKQIAKSLNADIEGEDGATEKTKTLKEIKIILAEFKPLFALLALLGAGFLALFIIKLLKPQQGHSTGRAQRAGEFYVRARIEMKQIQIPVMFFATILFCGIVMAGTTNTNNVVTIESTQSRLQPQPGVTYRIVANWIYKTAEPGPAEMRNALAWSLANEFVFRTNLRELFVLPASASGKRKEDALFSVTFARKAGGKQLTLLVDPKSKTVQIKEDN